MVKFSDFDVCKKFVHKDKAKIINYLLALYSKESALNNIQNLSERKREACRQAKLNEHDQEVIQIMDLQHEEVNKLIFEYFSTYQNSNKYHKLCADQQLFWNIQKILMSSVDITDEDELMDRYKKRGELSKTSDDLLLRINKYYSEIYSIEEVKEMAITHVRQMMRPEERIKMRDAS